VLSSEAVSAVDDKATAIRTSGVSLSYSLEEVSWFYAFLISVKSLVKALEWAGDRRLPGAHSFDRRKRVRDFFLCCCACSTAAIIDKRR
jgi:hypothetical protein